MIKIEDGTLKIEGHGSVVAPEVGDIMQYFFENCTTTETVEALEAFKDGLSENARVKFVACLTMVMK